MYKSEIEVSPGTSISIESGNWSKQAHGSVVYRSGNLLIHATICAARDAREGQDFFPLTVEYREKIFSVGRFPGGYIKRENRPAEHEILLSRLIDRPIRPLFPEGYYSEVQLLVQVYSSDESTSIQGHAITAASAALMASDIPFHGPIAGVLVGRVNGEFVANPTTEQMEESDLDLIVAGSADAISMIEGGAGELSNEEVLNAISFAHDFIKGQLKMQTDLAAEMKIEKRELNLRLPDEALQKELKEFARDKMDQASSNSDKASRNDEVRKVYEETVDHFKKKLEGADNFDQSIKDIKEGLHSLEADVIRTQIFEKNVRADGRALDEIRDISVELDVLPGAHGSSVFTRGQTQSLGVVTLGTKGDNQRYETLAGQQAKNFMLHYNFPPYSVGEVRRFGFPGRREIGHGNLAERALKYIVPNQDEFPYVIRVVSEIMESNGSSSMASVCSGSMAMMAAGVPLKKAVSGIAMGLITDESGDYRILSDIAGLEDHFGDMDFKITGTRDGITAFQLDIKVTGISLEIMKKALIEAEKARLHILEKMEAAIPDHRQQVPDHAPRITTIKIDPERIGELIGPGGKVIRGIIEKTGAEVNVEDDGSVTISSVNGKSNELAQKMVEDIFREVEVGEIYDGTVKKVTDFGAFVELVPGKEGLVHISKLDVERVGSVRDVVNEGDPIKVKVIGVDRMGRIDLSRKDLLPGGESSGDDRDRGGDRGGRGGGDRDRGGRSGGGDRDRGGDRGGRGGGRGGDRDRAPSGGGGRGGRR